MEFTVILEKGEDGFILAHCPALPGCHSQGRRSKKLWRTSRRRSLPAS